MLGLLSHVTDVNVPCKMMMVRDIQVPVLAGDTMITPRYLYLLHVKRFDLTTHPSPSPTPPTAQRDSTVLLLQKQDMSSPTRKKFMPMMSNIPIKIHHE